MARLVSSAPLMPAGKPEVVLDPARGAGLAAQRGGLDHQRRQPLGRAVHGGAKAGRAATDDHQVDLLTGIESSPSPMARETSPFEGLRRSGPPGSRTRGSSIGCQRLDQRGRLRVVAVLGVAPVQRQPAATGEVDQAPRVWRRTRPDDLDAHTLALLEDLRASR